MSEPKADFMTDLNADFLADLPNRISEMEILLNELKKNNNLEFNFKELYRLAHSLKGNASTYGFNAIAMVTHALESEFENLKDKLENASPEFFVYCFGFIDLIHESIGELQLGESRIEDLEQNVADLRTNSPFYRKHSALIVEPSRFTEQQYEKSIATFPISIRTAESVYLALNSLLQERFDFLLTSYTTLDLNGIALIAAAKMTPDIAKRTTCILITSESGLHFDPTVKPDFIVKKSTKMMETLQAIIEKKLND